MLYEVITTDIYVVDVEQHCAAAAVRQFGEKLPLRDGGLGELQVAGDVLYQHLPPKTLLDLIDARDHMRQRLLRAGQWQQVVQIAPAH